MFFYLYSRTLHSDAHGRHYPPAKYLPTMHRVQLDVPAPLQE